MFGNCFGSKKKQNENKKKTNIEKLKKHNKSAEEREGEET